jgi:hypothetical protein
MSLWELGKQLIELLVADSAANCTKRCMGYAEPVDLPVTIIGLPAAVISASSLTNLIITYLK